MIDDDPNDAASLFADDARAACLCDVGAPGWAVTVAVAADGSERLILADLYRVGDTTARCDSSCRTIDHEQVGPLPLDVAQRIAIAQRVHRCGRRTKSGTPCRLPVSQLGGGCHFHRNGRSSD